MSDLFHTLMILPPPRAEGTGKEREQLRERMLQAYPPYPEYQQKTKREALVVVL
ncbi:MAG: nitroreductase/quinone reductase family protein [Candidatus Binatia bacterium]